MTSPAVWGLSVGRLFETWGPAALKAACVGDVAGQVTIWHVCCGGVLATTVRTSLLRCCETSSTPRKSNSTGSLPWYHNSDCCRHNCFFIRIRVLLYCSPLLWCAVKSSCLNNFGKLFKYYNWNTTWNWPNLVLDHGDHAVASFTKSDRRTKSPAPECAYAAQYGGVSYVCTFIIVICSIEY